MIDHLTLRCRDFARSRDFYVAALKPLGYEVVMSFGEMVGLGARGKPDLWLTPGEVGTPNHVAFGCPDRATVDAFHQAALEAGGRDEGAPGLRPDYHPNYYAAFVLDPDGHNIEAVCHAPLAAKPAHRAGKPVAHRTRTRRRPAKAARR